MRLTLDDNLAIAAAKYPDQLAYKCENKRLSYVAFDKLTSQLARTLLGSGLQKGDRVGVFLNRCLESPVAVYGILKAGGVFVPMDPMAPSDRNLFVAKDVGMKILITSDQQRFQLRKIDLSPTTIHTMIGTSNEVAGITSISWDQVSSASADPINLGNGVDDLAYIMYTSGSTGTPKGIMHTHSSGMSYARLSKELYNVAHTDIVANHSPLHFDMSTFGYFTSVYAGATTILISDAYANMPTSLGKLMHDEKISIWYSVPLALIQLLENNAINNTQLTHLKWVLFGGEPFPPSLVRRLMKRMPYATWSNVYGPAEVNQCTYYNFKDLPAHDHPLPLGQIWADTLGLIVDEKMNELSHNDIGELLIASPTKMKGYWRNKELTEKSCYVNQKDGKEYYRTGDLVSRDENGILHFHGRKDRQVKIRGHRIELEEIEIAFRSIEGIEHVVAFAVKKEDHSKLLCVAIEIDGIMDEGEIKSIIAQKVPKYAQPSRYIFVSELPRTAAGKVDYRKLEAISKS